MSDSAFPGLSLAEEIFKSIVWDTIVKGIQLKLFGPALELPVVGDVLRFITQKIADSIYDAIRINLDIAAIGIYNEHNKNVYKDASIRLRVIALRNGIDSEEFKKERENAKAALAKFICFG